MTYFYGVKDEEFYYHNSLSSLLLYEAIFKNDIIVEMKKSKDGERFCQFGKIFNPECGENNCDYYTPRNGKSGICEHLDYGLVETGRKWIVLENDPGIKGLKKISPRSR
jgi:hypothetical protein